MKATNRNLRLSCRELLATSTARLPSIELFSSDEWLARIFLAIVCL